LRGPLKRTRFFISYLPFVVSVLLGHFPPPRVPLTLRGALAYLRLSPFFSDPRYSCHPLISRLRVHPIPPPPEPAVPLFTCDTCTHPVKFPIRPWPSVSWSPQSPVVNPLLSFFATRVLSSSQPPRPRGCSTVHSIDFGCLFCLSSQLVFFFPHPSSHSASRSPKRRLVLLICFFVPPPIEVFLSCFFSLTDSLSGGWESFFLRGITSVSPSGTSSI